MKCLLICDESKPETVVDLCRQRGMGIEVQGFYHPSALSDPVLLKRRQTWWQVCRLSRCTAPLETSIQVRSIHS